MSRLNSTYENAIIQWAFGAMAIPVMWDFQDAPKTGRGPTRKEIKLPYATVGYVTGPQAVGGGFDLSFKEEDTYTYKFYKQFVISVNVYAKESHMAYIQSLMNSIHLPGKNAVLRQAGLSNWGISSPQDISEILDTKSQLRAAIDFTFAYREDVDDESGVIQVVNISGDVGDIETSTSVSEESP